MPLSGRQHGGVAQLARALGSYPSCHRFESSRRYHPEEAARPLLRASLTRPPWAVRGPVVKRLRHRPFTAVTRVRFPSGSPIWRLSSAGRALASHARGHRFEFCSLHQDLALKLNGLGAFSCKITTFWACFLSGLWPRFSNSGQFAIIFANFQLSNSHQTVVPQRFRDLGACKSFANSPVSGRVCALNCRR